jgi:glycosyltransferase involved in cell wall biosynthesis
MKIGIFLPNATFDLPGSPEVGGIETFSFTVGEALQQLGHEVVLFGGEPKPGRSFRHPALTLELSPYWETKSIPDLGTRFQRLVQRIHFAWSSRHAWNKHRCDVVLLAKPFDWPVAWWWKRSRPELKVIMGFHGTDFFAGDRTFFKAVDASFAVSKTVADLAEKHVGVRPAIIPNPVNVDFFCPDDVPRAVARTDWHLASTGRLVGWKGFSNLIEAVARLRDEHGITAYLSIGGDGPERENLRAQSDALNLKSQVQFRGLLEPAALLNLLQLSDLYVLPSIGMEAFSIGALEAACVGLPLALSDQVGLAGFLTEADCATYPARDVDALVSLLKKLHERRYDAQWVDATARRSRLLQQFSPERVARRLLDLTG